MYFVFQKSCFKENFAIIPAVANLCLINKMPGKAVNKHGVERHCEQKDLEYIMYHAHKVLTVSRYLLKPYSS